MKETSKTKKQPTKSAAKTTKSTAPRTRKSSKKSGGMGKIIGAILCVLLVVGAGVFLVKYFNDKQGSELPDGIISERYVVVPYTGEAEATPVASALSPTDASNGFRRLSSGTTEIDTTSEKKAVKLRQWPSEGYTYYQFYVGYIKNVPIAWEIPAHYDGNELNITFSTSRCTEEAVEKSLTTCEEVTTSSSYSVSASATVTVEGDFIVSKTELSATASWEGSWQNSKAVSASDTYTTARRFTNETTYELNYLITGNKYGYYRYTLFGTTDVYAIARTKDGKSFDLTYEQCAREDSYFYAVDYSETSDFTASTSSEKLELSAKECEGLALSEQPPEEVVALKSYHYDSSKLPSTSTLKNRAVITDKGAFGMATPYDSSDKLDMTSLLDYQSELYIFEFKFVLNVNEVDDGYQEFYLYNKFLPGDVTEDGMKQSVAAQLKGMVAYCPEIDTDDSKLMNSHEIIFRLPGNVIEETMYTKFGAHGHLGDDWKVSQLTCDVKIYEASPQVILNSEKEISSQDNYGVSCTEKADRIDLSAFSSSLNNNNTFTFVFAVTMKEKNDGYQELYLYSNNTYKDGDSWEEALEGGLITVITGTGKDDYRYDYGFEEYNKTDENYSTVYFTVQVSGGSLARNVYLRYGASGGSTDNWYVNNVTVYISANEN